VQKSVVLTVIEAKEVTLKWKTPAHIRYGKPLGPDQLNAEASVAGTFVYSPAEGTVLAAGAQTLMVTFIPDDDVTYAATQGSVTLVVERGDQATSLSANAPISRALPEASSTTGNHGLPSRKHAPEPAPRNAAEVRVYKGATYVKEADGQWHLQKQ
jgi:hypothetical protein